MTRLTASYISHAHPYSFKDFFSLSVQHSWEATKICMKVYTSFVNTKYLPTTYSILQEKLPTILHSTCFNENNLPFKKEVVQTEIGHLFEHVLLEYLCILKLAQGSNEASFEGLTNWNWEQDPIGTFHITVGAGYKEIGIFSKALEKTIQLMKIILNHRSFLTPSF